MKSLSLLAATLIALSAGAIQTASAQQCTGPFAQCARDVNAQCPIGPDGQQVIRYWDAMGNTQSFQRCVTGIFEANGQLNPYTSEGMAAVSAGPGPGQLAFPRTQLLYPTNNP